MGSIGSICNFMTYIPDDGIKGILEEESEESEKKEFARKLVGQLG